MNRFKKRIGVEITEVDFNEINQLITEGSAEAQLVVWKRKNDVGIYRVKWKKLTFYAIYLYPENRVISFKPLGAALHADLRAYYDNH